jgi:hypothetical protein
MRTLISPSPARSGLLAAAVAGSLLLGATGCGGGGDAENAGKARTGNEAVAGTQLCGGDALSPDAAEALKVITGSPRFAASAEEYTLEQAAVNLVNTFPGTDFFEDVCRVYTPPGTPDFELRITWGLVGGPPTGTPAPKFTVLKMGQLAATSEGRAYIRFACRSDRLSDATRLAHIEITVERARLPNNFDVETDVLKDAYATVAHSVSLAMARELRCEDDGGLPAQPVLEPA